MGSMTTPQQSGRAPLARNFLVLFMSNTLGQILFLGGTIILARTVGAVAYGWWGFSQAVFGYLLRGGELGLEVTGIRAIGRDPSVAANRVGHVLVIRFVLALALCAGALVVAFTGVLPAASVPLLMVFAVGVFPVAVSLEWLFEALQTPLLSGVARIIKGVVFFGLVLWLVDGPDTLTLSVWLYVMSLTVPAVVLLVLGWRRIGRFDFALNPRSVVAMLREAMPIGIATLLSQYSLFFGTVYLGFTAVGDELGLYTASHRLVIFVWAYGIVAANRVLLPRMSYLHGQAPAEFGTFVRSGARALLILALPIGMGGSLLAGVVTAAIYGPAYAGSAVVFQILVWALVIAVVGAVFEVSLIAADRQHIYLQGMILAAVLHTIAAPVGLHLAGIAGIAMGMVCAEACYAGFVIIRSGTFGLMVFLRQSWKILLAGGLGLAASQAAGGQPILMAGIALVVYAGSLWGLREVTSADAALFLRLLGLPERPVGQ